ncbi:MAG: hypothetical protein A2X61_08275 [Ignavibacteria bacterium GWB2_35_12]|nr:MAG: hypothetical protein A2X61_08275 [Ignavibacteria bacterium GWB2_35_12]OGU90762.1 MAG: hypothetical protein A2220_05425 [Ignavibacteria bacterium RIFOXYA2_FULL_35_10]OGV23720.1 MAG: hypothetical protein A2475_02190 [Ignavibacteria bacterium RIFOXYC2_FULL_35_21]
MNTATLIKEAKKLRKKDKERLIIETIKDLDEFEEIEDALDILKSKYDREIDWNEAKKILEGKEQR